MKKRGVQVRPVNGRLVTLIAGGADNCGGEDLRQRNEPPRGCLRRGHLQHEERQLLPEIPLGVNHRQSPVMQSSVSLRNGHCGIIGCELVGRDGILLLCS